MQRLLIKKERMIKDSYIQLSEITISLLVANHLHTSNKRTSAGTLSPTSQNTMSPGTSFAAKKSLHSPFLRLENMEKVKKVVSED